MNTRYPHLHEFSKSIGVAPERLIQAFEIEQIFHKKILDEESFDIRQKLYEDVYNKVHQIYGRSTENASSDKNPKDYIVRIFNRELKNKSILDVGCGEGHFLTSVSKNLPHKDLVGIDVSKPHLAKNNSDIEFILGNIINFKLDRTFDVVFSDQVLEHIAPADLPIHLASVRSALHSDGIFIVNLPNRLFGPSDVTRIIDYTNTGKIHAQGTHLNESTYTELIPILKDNGFTNFKTTCFIPKIKNLLINYRFSPAAPLIIERHPLLLKLLRSIKLHGRCAVQLSVTLICNKH